MNLKLLGLAPLALFLAACGGGGGGGGATVLDPGTPSLPSNGAFRGLSGIASSTSSGIVVGNIQSTTGQYSSTSQTTGFQFQSGVDSGRSYTFNNETGRVVSANPALPAGEDAIFFAAGDGMEFVRVGYVERFNNNTSFISVGYGGASTTNMPNSGTANYSGGFIGLGHNNNQVGYVLGELGMTANFGAATVQGQIDTYWLNGGGASFGRPVTFSGNIAGSNFTGNASFAGDGSGQIDGGFFGPGAAEVGGAIVVVDGTTEAIAGGFAGKRQ